MRMGVQSLALLSGLRSLRCHELWCRLQTRLRSHVAVCGSGVGQCQWLQLGLDPPAWEPPYATGAALEKAKRQKKKKYIYIYIYIYIKIGIANHLDPITQSRISMLPTSLGHDKAPLQSSSLRTKSWLPEISYWGEFFNKDSWVLKGWHLVDFSGIWWLLPLRLYRSALSDGLFQFIYLQGPAQ